VLMPGGWMSWAVETRVDVHHGEYR
jgi:hypothetical protein